MADELSASLNTARETQISPPQERRVQQLSTVTQLPVDTVRRNQSTVERRLEFQPIDTDALRQRGPGTAQWLSEPANARRAYDDAEVLAGIEAGYKRRPGLIANAGRNILQRGNVVVGNLIQAVGMAGRSFAETLDSVGIPDPGIIFGEDGISWSWDVPTDTPAIIEEVGRQASYEGAGAASGYVPTFTWENFKGEPTVANLAGFVAEAGPSSLVDMLAAVTMLPAYLTSTTQEIAEVRAANTGKSDVDLAEFAKSAPTAVLVSLIERFSTKGALGMLAEQAGRPAVGEIGRAIVREAGTEFVQEAIQYAGETIGTDKVASLTEMLDRGVAGAVVGGPMGGAVRTGSLAFEAIANRQERATIRNVSSTLESDTLDTVFSAIRDQSKLYQEDPDGFKDWLATAKLNDKLYISPEAVETLVESGATLPAYVTDQLGNSQDVEVTLEQFSFDVLSDEALYTALRPHVKRDPGGLTPAELKMRGDTSLQSLLESARRDQEVLTEAEEIYEEVVGQLVATGRQGRDTARLSAQIIPAYVTTQVARLRARGNDVTVRDVYDRMGLSVERMAEETPGALAQDTAPVFRSAFNDTLRTNTNLPKKGNATVWKEKLAGEMRKGSFKQSEYDWLEVDTWLDGRESTTREELQQYVESRQVQVQDVVLGDAESEQETRRLAVVEMRKQGIENPTDEQVEDFLNEYGYDITDARDVAPMQPKFAQHTLPGGENYRELLLTLPSEQAAVPDTIAAMNDSQLADFIQFNDRNAEPDGLTRDQLLELADSTGLEDGDIRAFVQKGAKLDRAQGTFRSSHFDQPNILTHVRFNERTDADGNKVLFIEEIQSDWHQAGRKKGYKKGDVSDAEVMAAEEKARAVLKKNDNLGYDTTGQAISDVYREGAGWAEVWPDHGTAEDRAAIDDWITLRSLLELEKTSAVPNAPFKATDEWAMLAFKRMVRYAAENGFDKIAWTTGDQQADRYDLSKQVDRIVVPTVDVDGRAVRIDQTDGGPAFKLVVGTDGTVTKGYYGASQFSGKPLSDVIGKEMAEKVMAAEAGTEFEGSDLKVGGEGMRGFYDKILPAAVNKWAKKFGGKVTTTDMGNKGYTEVMGESAMPQPSLALTPAMREAALQGLPLFQDRRGEYDLTTGAIRLSQTSNLSTFLHEAAHLFLHAEAKIAAEFGADDQALAIAEFLQTDDLSNVTREQHEKFARTFEEYLKTGEAPSLALRDAFYAFARWLAQIYNSLVPGAVEITPDVRATFDRILATETEIAEALASPAYAQLFKNKKRAGMTDAEWKAYEERVAKRKTRASVSVFERLMKEYRAQRSQEWNAEREPLVDAALEALRSERLYVLINAVTSTHKLDRAIIEGYTGEPVTGRLKEATRNGADAVDPRAMAEQFGYENVIEMLDEIQNAPSIADAAIARAEQQMRDRHGDILNDGTLEQEVQEAVHSDEQAKLLYAELRATGRRTRTIAPDRDVIKAQAEATVATMTMSELKPDKYLRAEIRAAQRAAKARSPAEAYAAKLQQLANHYLYRSVTAARVKSARYRAAILKAQRAQYPIAVVDAGYTQAIRQYAGMYDVGKGKRSAEDRRAKANAFMGWLQTQLTSGAVLYDLVLARMVAADAENSEFTLPNLEELTVADLRGAYEQLKHLRYVGGREADRETAALRTEAASNLAVVSSVKSTVKGDGFSSSAVSGTLDALRGLKESLASLRNLIRVIEGRDDAEGSLYRSVYLRFEQGQNAVLATHEAFNRTWDEMMAGFMKAGIGELGSVAYTHIDGSTGYLSSRERFMAAVYYGSPEGRAALLDGHKITDAEAQRIISTLTDEQLSFVNKLWAFNETMAAPLFEAGRLRQGVAPPRVQAAPFTVRGIKMSGGYSRIYYDGLAPDVKVGEDAMPLTNTLTSGLVGSLIARKRSGGNRLDLNTDNVFRAMAENAHYIGFAKPSWELQRVFNRKDIQAAIVAKHGRAFQQALLNNLHALTTGKRESETLHIVGKASNYFRKNLSAAWLMYSVKNTVQNITGFVPAVTSIGPRVFAAEMLDFYKDYGYLSAWVDSKSIQQRSRRSFIDRNATEVSKNTVTGSSAEAAYRTFLQHGFTPQWAIDSVISKVVWRHKYRESMARHGDEDLAISEADNQVAEIIGTGLDMHMGKLFQSNQAWWVKSLTMFGSFFNSSMFQRAYRGSKGFTTVRTRAAFEALVITPIVFSMVNAALVLDLPDEDSEESVTRWFFRQLLSTYGAMAFLPRSLISEWMTGMPSQSALSSAGSAITTDVPRTARQLIEGEPIDPAKASDILALVSTFLPVAGAGNVMRTLDYTQSSMEGNEGPVYNPYQAVVEGKDKN